MPGKGARMAGFKVPLNSDLRCRAAMANAHEQRCGEESKSGAQDRANDQVEYRKRIRVAVYLRNEIPSHDAAQDRPNGEAQERFAEGDAPEEKPAGKGGAHGADGAAQHAGNGEDPKVAEHVQSIGECEDDAEGGGSSGGAERGPGG